MARDRSILMIPNDTSYLPVVGGYVKAVAAQLGFGEMDMGDIRLPVDEACTHIISTAFEPGEQKDLSVSCQCISSGLKISIADKGLPFEPGHIQAYDAQGGLDRDLEGLPLFLIQRVMDEVHFVNRGWEGKEIQLIKYLEIPDSEAYVAQVEMPHDHQEVEPAPPGRYEYRLMEPEDAVGITRCVYKTYDYTYLGEHVYFPDRIRAMNQSSEMVSAVAVTESGEVVGHCALSGRPGDPVMEVSQAVVAPSHRGRGLLSKLMDLLMEEAYRRDLSGLYVQAVTLHPYSQRACSKYGFHESALFLGYAPQAVQMKEFADQGLPQRESIIYGYQALQEDLCSRVYPPAHHRAAISSIFAHLGLEREYASAGGPGLVLEPDRAELSASNFSIITKAISALGIGTIQVVKYGSGAAQELKSKLKDLCHEEIAVIYLKLPLGDANTALICQQAEDLGFFFAGIQPWPSELTAGRAARSRDLLCLQFFNGSRINYELLEIYSDFGKNLTEYVMENDPLA